MNKNSTIIFFPTVAIFVFISVLLIAPSKAQRRPLTQLDQQALEQARQFFGRMYTRCGEYYYFKHNQGMGFLYQCKYAPSISVKGVTLTPRQLSEADRLNGVDPLPVSWDGHAIINLGLCRHQAYYQKDEPGYNGWGQWSDSNTHGLPLTNKKGQWEFRNKLGAIGGDKVIVPVTCNDVPSAEKRNAVKPPYWDGRAYEGYILKIPSTYGQWYSLGRGPMVIEPVSPYSDIHIDGSNVPKGPGGRDIANNEALAPGLKWGAIILKIGQNGSPVQAFTDTISYLDGYKVNSGEEVFIAINDSYFLDNRGEHVVTVRGPNMSASVRGGKGDRLGLELGDYCKRKYGDSAIAVSADRDTFSWRCKAPYVQGGYSYFEMNMDEACRQRHGDNYKATYDSPYDQNSWHCVSTASNSSVTTEDRFSASSTSGTTEDKYFIRVFNCDDGCTAVMNEALVVNTGFGEDSGWIDVTDWVIAGRSKIGFQVSNNQGAIAYGFAVKKNEELVFEKKCGTSGVVGCENNREDFPVGVARQFTFNIVLTSDEKVGRPTLKRRTPPPPE